MPETMINTKIIDAFVSLDIRDGIPDNIKYVDGSTIFPSVVCNYTDVAPNTNDAMGKRLLRSLFVWCVTMSLPYCIISIRGVQTVLQTKRKKKRKNNPDNTSSIEDT